MLAFSITSQELNHNDCLLGAWSDLEQSIAEIATVLIDCARSNMGIDMNALIPMAVRC